MTEVINETFASSYECKNDIILLLLLLPAIHTHTILSMYTVEMV